MTATSIGAPPTRSKVVTDVLHGTEIPDPYRWLEDPSSPETAAWISAQNDYTRSVLDAFPGRAAIRQRLAQFLSIGTVQPPVLRGGRYFFVRREGSENQPRLFVREAGEDRVLLDPNSASEEGTVALDWWYPSWDGQYVAYGYSSHGDERSTLYVVSVDTMRQLSDVIPHTRYASIGWRPDNVGFYYTRTPQEHWQEDQDGDEYYHRAVYFHRLGDSIENDVEVYPDDGDPQTQPSIAISADGRWLLLIIHRGWESADVYLRDLSAPQQEFTPVAVGLDALFSGSLEDDRLYLLTNLDAPRYRLLGVDPLHPEREQWRELIAERDDAVLEDFVIAHHGLVAKYLHNASSALFAYSCEGGDEREIFLPVLGSVTGLTGLGTSDEVFFGFESFTLPPVVYRYDAASHSLAEWARVVMPFSIPRCETRQAWYESRDGTRVSMFLVRGTEVAAEGSAPPDSRRPTLLTGYGGFNISRTPLFNRGLLLWLERGGLYALPNLRGGGEYGEEWHRAGKLANKQNVFDDFVAAAEYLIAQRYTDPEHLSILGGSNGGLLVGAALTQRPDLFRAVVCAVPLLDMLRYHQFLIARLWVPEYGSADDPEQFRYLLEYSPYHHVEDGVAYPAVLLTTAASDSRVDPLHARKMTARLQSATSSSRPILLRTEFGAGHGIGKPLIKVLDSETDVWSFLLSTG